MNAEKKEEKLKMSVSKEKNVLKLIETGRNVCFLDVCIPFCQV
jgi:hypothetical protein